MGRSPSASNSLRFARVAGTLTTEARRLGLVAPGFRSPPRLAEADRTIRRARWGAVVAVRLRDRAFESVVGDMVDGVVAANRLEGDAARRTRVLLLQAVLRGDDERPTVRAA